MSFASISRQLLALAALAVAAGTAQGATTYELKSMTMTTSSAGGIYPFGVAPLGASFCFSCGTSIVVDDGFGNLTVGSVHYSLGNFGGDIDHTFSGTTTVGGTSLIKSAEACVDGPKTGTTPHLCDPTDRRGWAGNWNTGFLPDGTTAAPVAAFSAIVSGQNLTLNVRKNRDAVGGSDTAWLAIQYNYQVVPVPAAVWLFGSALGLMGIARRRSLAAQA